MDNASRQVSPVLEAGASAAVESDSEKNSAETATGITPQIMTVIQSAVNAYLGRKARILSVRVGSELQGRSSWATEGRTLLCESHNTIQRGH